MYKHALHKTHGLKKNILIAAAILLSLAGCQPEPQLPSQSAEKVDLTTPAGMKAYLQNLPGVDDIQLWPNNYGPGIVITTRHYKIHTTLMAPLMLSRVPGFVESAYSAYQQQLPKPIETKTKFTTYLFATRSQWEAFTTDFVGPGAQMYFQIKKGAYCFNGVCVAYNIGRSRTFAVLGHEGWHQFNSKHFTYRLPSWLDEGIATLFETSFCSNGRFVFRPDRNLGRLGALQNTLKSGKMIPLEQLITLNPGEVLIGSDVEGAMAFYAQSHALVRFLREEDYGKRLNSYHNLLLGALRGTWPLEPALRKIAADRNIPLTVRWNRIVSPKLFALYIDNDLQLIESEYTAFCRKLVYHLRPKK